MMKNNKHERALRRFEAVQIALAKEDAKHMPSTSEIERDVEALYATGRRRMATSPGSPRRRRCRR